MKNTIEKNQWVNGGTQKINNCKNYLRTWIIAALMGCSVWMAQEVAAQNQNSTQTEDVKKSAFSVHGMVSFWTNGVAWDAADVCSTNPTFIGMVNVSHKSWVALTATRLSDWKKDPNQKASKLTLINWSVTKELWRNFKAVLEWKYIMFDKNPQGNSISTNAKLLYTKNNFNAEVMRNHNFKNWNNLVRSTVSKNVGKNTKLTAQWWYGIENKSPFWRAIADQTVWKNRKNPNNRVVIQGSFTGKNKKITPNLSVIGYR